MGPQLGRHHQWRCTDTRHGRIEVVLHCDWMPAPPPRGWFWTRTHNRWMNIHTKRSCMHMCYKHAHSRKTSKRSFTDIQVPIPELPNISLQLKVYTDLSLFVPFVFLWLWTLLTSQRSGLAGYHHVVTGWTRWFVSSPPSWQIQSSTHRLFWPRRAYAQKRRSHTSHISTVTFSTENDAKHYCLYCT